MAFSLSKFRTASAGLAGLAFIAGCGGGGDSGIDRPAPGFAQGELPNVKTVATPLGTAGSRGSGAAVFVSVTLVDREFNLCDAQIEYGWDGNNGGVVDGIITGSDGDPSATDEYSPATPHATSPIGYNQATNQPELHPWNLEASRGKGADHVFVWDSAQDLPGRRYVTVDYSYLNDGWDGTPTGRLEKNSDGTDKLVSLPGLRLRMRANDGGGGEARWSPWTTTQPFDINNNHLPVVTIDVTPLKGVVANATGTAADEDVELKFHAYDDDTGTPAGFMDRAAVHIDYAPADTTMTVLAGAINTGGNYITKVAHGLADGNEVVLLSSTGTLPAGINAEQTYFVKVTDANVFTLTDTFNESQGVPSGLGEDIDFFTAGTGTHTFGVNFQWAEANPFSGIADTSLITDTVPLGGEPHSYKWDSVADVGTVNGDYILRITPFDLKNENGATVVMDSWFRLDNYTIFTDASVALPTARVGHRLTTLADGTVLIAGGREVSGGNSVDKVVLFYPSIGQTTRGAMANKAPMLATRAYHTQTRLYDDRVLVAGGFGGASTPRSTLEIYDPIANTWTTSAASMTVARARHTAVLLANGDVLLAGGVDSLGIPLSSADIYHPDTDTITAAGSAMNAARHSVGGVLLPDYRVMIPGGTGTGGSSLSSVEIFDPTANLGAGGFSLGTPLPTARRNHTVSISTNGKVVVTGGAAAGVLNTITVFDPQANNWTNVGTPMSSARTSHVGVLMGDGQVLVAGGSNGASVLSSGQLYSPATGLYTSLNGVMVTARTDAESTILNNGRVLIVGGLDNAGQPIPGIEIFTPDNGFNYVPTARAATPEEPQSYLFGAVVPVRLVDTEEDRARFIALYSYFDIGTNQYTAWKSCTPAGGPYGDGVPDTIADDYSDGVVDLESTDTDLPLPINPAQDNTSGDEADHNFIWKIDSDIPVRQDYDLVKVRIIPFGAAQGTAGTTFAFKVVSNTRVIPRLNPFSPPVGGAIRMDYHLLDIDGAVIPGPGDSARVEFQYAIDVNGDGQILDTSGEFWEFCTMAPGGDGLGAGYTLSTYSSYDPDISTPGWHIFMWDSVHDLGSPDPSDLIGENDYFNDSNYTAADGNKKLLVRLVPYDDPTAGGPTTETKGRLLTFGEADGLVIERDPNSLWLDHWATEGGVTYSGSTIANVKIDEHLIFTFNRDVDVNTVNDVTIAIRVGTRKILGTFDVAGPVVTFYPKINNVSNGTLAYTGAELVETILSRNMTIHVNIPGYVPGTNPETTNILRINPAQWTAGDAASDVAIVHGNANNNAFTTPALGTVGAQAYLDRNVNPQVTSSTPARGAVGQSLTQGFTFTFNYPISPDSCTALNMKFRVDQNGNFSANTNDSVIPGNWTVVNTVGPAGTCQAVVTFTPLTTLTLPEGNQALAYPTGSVIVADFSAITAGDGDPVYGQSPTILPSTHFTTSGAVTNTFAFSETFLDTLNKDTTPGATTALWNVSPYTGMLTGNRDGGSGADGAPSTQVNSIVGNLWTFSAKNDYNFTSFTIPKAQIWRFTGGASNLPVTIRSTTTIDIAGVLDVSGNENPTLNGYMPSTAGQSSYNMRYTTSYSTGTIILVGGSGVAGGGKGGDVRWLTTGTAGTPGSGAVVANAGAASGMMSATNHIGGGGGGHAQQGGTGGQYTSGTPPAGTGVGGTSYGSSTAPVSAGSGGGGGSCYTSSGSGSEQTYNGSGSYVTYYYHGTGGSGGGGGGALKMTCNGACIIRATGLVDASGGNGQDGWYAYTSAGGGGSGGSIWIITGGELKLFGLLDVRGGLGGEAVYTSTFGVGSPPRYGSCGGDGSAGRVRLEGQNVTGTQINIVGGAAINTIAESNAGALFSGVGGGGLNAFPGSSTATINLDSYARDAQGYYNFTTMSIPAGITVTLQGSYPARMRFTGAVTINGTLRAPGTNGPAGYTGSFSGTAYTYPAVNGNCGSGAAGLPNPASTTTFTNGQNGIGTGPSGTGGGFGGLKTGVPTPWVSGSTTYQYNPSAGGGGANRINPPAIAIGQNYTSPTIGAVSGGNVFSIANRKTAGNFAHYYTGYYNAPTVGGAVGVGGIDPELVMMGPTAPVGGTFVGGSGGGGGANGGYYSGSIPYFYYAGTPGASGGGAIGIETTAANSVTIGSTGLIECRGGIGGTYCYQYYGSAGGGGAGGTVLIRTGTFNMAVGGVIDTLGGLGGISYQPYSSYRLFGGDGGVGGPGVVRIESTAMPNVLNTGAILGLTASHGSLSVNTNVGGGPLGTMKWKNAAGLAPDFYTQGIVVAPSNSWWNKNGNVVVTLQGQMMDPITGAPSSLPALNGSQDISVVATQLQAAPGGTPDPIDGYMRWRFVYTLNPATQAVPNAPELLDVGVNVRTK